MQWLERDSPMFCPYQCLPERLNGVHFLSHLRLQSPSLLVRNVLQHLEACQRLPEEDLRRHVLGAG